MFPFCLFLFFLFSSFSFPTHGLLVGLQGEAGRQSRGAAPARTGGRWTGGGRTGDSSRSRVVRCRCRTSEQERTAGETRLLQGVPGGARALGQLKRITGEGRAADVRTVARCSNLEQRKAKNAGASGRSCWGEDRRLSSSGVSSCGVGSQQGQRRGREAHGLLQVVFGGGCSRRISNRSNGGVALRGPGSGGDARGFSDCKSAAAAVRQRVRRRAGLSDWYCSLRATLVASRCRRRASEGPELQRHRRSELAGRRESAAAGVGGGQSATCARWAAAERRAAFVEKEPTKKKHSARLFLFFFSFLFFSPSPSLLTSSFWFFSLTDSLFISFF